MIHGMTKPFFEFQHNCIHVHNSDVCNGCWHRDETLNLKGDWNICPDHKGTNRMFECSKNITPEKVYDAIEEVKKSLDNTTMRRDKFNRNKIRDKEAEFDKKYVLTQIEKKQ